MKGLLVLALGLIASASIAFAEKQDISDAQIMDIVITANNAVSEAGELAQAKSSNEAAKAHARMVNKHHTDVTKIGK